MSTPSSYILYGSPVSLYTGKVRSYMRKNKIPYEERLTCHPEYASRIIPTVGRYVIPVIETPDGTIVQDTSEIIDYLETRHQEPSVYPLTPKQHIISLIFELFGDEGLLKPAMHYRWSFTQQNDDFISLEFGRFVDPTASNKQAKELANIPKSKMSGLLPALGITPETIPAIEANYKDLLSVLDAHFLKYPYLLGGRPTIGDFGLYAPLYAHLARDPAPSMLMKQTANRVWRWVERMTAPDLDKPEFPDMPGKCLAEDHIPDTLTPVLQLIAKDLGPELKGLIHFLNTWLADNKTIQEGENVLTEKSKRSLGFFPTTIRGTQTTLIARHYSIWMLQRVQDAFNTLSPMDKTGVQNFLETVDLGFLLTLKTNRRIERVNYTEVWGSVQTK